MKVGGSRKIKMRPDVFTTASNTPANPKHDFEQTLRFLKALDPGASKFTFQFLWDDKERRDRKEPLPSGMGRNVQDCAADEICSAIANWNSAACPVGCFVTVNETPLSGGKREAKDIRRIRAVFIDADARRMKARMTFLP
jgi:hypothetical protein